MMKKLMVLLFFGVVLTGCGNKKISVEPIESSETISSMHIVESNDEQGDSIQGEKGKLTQDAYEQKILLGSKIEKILRQHDYDYVFGVAGDDEFEEEMAYLLEDLAYSLDLKEEDSEKLLAAFWRVRESHMAFVKTLSITMEKVMPLDWTKENFEEKFDEIHKERKQMQANYKILDEERDDLQELQKLKDDLMVKGQREEELSVLGRIFDEVEELEALEKEGKLLEGEKDQLIIYRDRMNQLLFKDTWILTYEPNEVDKLYSVSFRVVGIDGNGNEFEIANERDTYSELTFYTSVELNCYNAQRFYAVGATELKLIPRRIAFNDEGRFPQAIHMVMEEFLN